MAQAPDPQKLIEYAFRKRFARFKLWISFKKGGTMTFYGQETTVTHKQIDCGHVKEVVFNRKAGYLNCIKMVENPKWRGTYITAIIFDRLAKKEIRKYVAGNIVEDTVLKWTEDTEKIPTMYISDSNGGWHLEPILSRLQFKQLIAQKLD